MRLAVLNIDGAEEICFQADVISNGFIDTQLIIQHDPFFVYTYALVSVPFISKISNDISKLYNGEIDHFRFVSSDLVFCIDVAMNPLGLIECSVTILVSGKGRLEFGFKSDRSFLPTILSSLKDAFTLINSPRTRADSVDKIGDDTYIL